jgi:vanadium chloroperoxidase
MPTTVISSLGAGIALAAPPHPTTDDPILAWNQVALEANRNSHTNGAAEQVGPTLSARALAIVHLAMYDAYAGAVNDAVNYPRYLAAPPLPSSAVSVEAAVAAAAHTTLVALFPSQASFFDQVLAAVGQQSDPGHAFGVSVGQAVLANRANDPGAGSSGYVPSTARGRHRVDPDNPGQGFYAPFYGAQSKGFGISLRFELAAPPLDNQEYRDALREVRRRGIAPELMGTLPSGTVGRSVDQSLIGLYWGYDGAANLGTPPRLYNQVVRCVARARGNSVGDNARLFALVNTAMADAGILAWDEKYRHDFWRPVVGIREHDRSMGPGATEGRNDVNNDCDSGWLPFGAPRTNSPGKNFTPPFPAYPSGHATFGAAALHITRLFYGEGGRLSNDSLATDTLFQGLTFVSDELDGVARDNKGTVRPRHVREFDGGLFQMIEENGRSRVYLGVHWVFDAFAVDANNEPDLARQVNGKYIGGVPLGLQIAEDVFDFGNGRAPKLSIVGPRP